MATMLALVVDGVALGTTSRAEPNGVADRRTGSKARRK